MSKQTDEFANEILRKTGARGVMVLLIGVGQTPGDNSSTVKCHPFLCESIPNALRKIADRMDKTNASRRTGDRRSLDRGALITAPRG